MTLVCLPKDHFVEITDVLTGGRKLGITDETGLGYFDLLGDGELPLPLHSELGPVDLGTINLWLEEQKGQKADALIDAWEYLTNQHLDVLTIGRALRWGMQNDSFDAAILEVNGKAETDRIRASRGVAQGALATS